MKKKLFLALLIAHCSLLIVFGQQQAVIRELTGTVEIKQPSSTTWETAAAGQAITADTIISTGFKSYALIGLGNSTLSVRPLTRLSLTEISAAAGTETLNVSLQAGRVRADVNPPAGARGSYTIRTPEAVASVRGTVFEIDAYRLWVIEGSVEFAGSSGAPVLIDAGGFSYVERTGRTALPEDTLFETLYPDLPIASDLLNSFRGGASRQERSFDINTIADFP